MRMTAVRRNRRHTLGSAPLGSVASSTGWEYVHIAIDDATRLVYAEVLGDEKTSTAIAFLDRAIAFYARHRITVERVLTDNGSAYRSAVHAHRSPRLGYPPSQDQAPPPADQRQESSDSSAPCSPVGPTAVSTDRSRERTAAL